MKCCLGLLTLELYFEWSHSLKDRRGVMNSVKEKLRRRFNVSITEADLGEVWQRGALMISCAGSNEESVERTFRNLTDFLDEDPRFQVISPQIRYYE